MQYENNTTQCHAIHTIQYNTIQYNSTSYYTILYKTKIMLYNSIKCEWKVTSSIPIRPSLSVSNLLKTLRKIKKSNVYSKKIFSVRGSKFVNMLSILWFLEVLKIDAGKTYHFSDRIGRKHIKYRNSAWNKSERIVLGCRKKCARKHHNEIFSCPNL